ncbi:MAG: beta-N-acetylhexosaminidase [Gammaproteobacteria bacterium]|nr:beta-N-acetylhexosaminidase [Gammaproteobacteria bacterium]
MTLGPLMIDVAGTTLQAEERERLLHPLVGGVILFSRNYTAYQALVEMVTAIHQLRKNHLLIAVDHEGGRVQRFRDGFTLLPAAAALGEIYDHDKRRGKELAQLHGWVMASELRAVGIDFSFAPVLDLNHGLSSVIGDRALSANPQTVATLALQQIAGIKQAGMAAVGKHFPGHGGVTADSHLATASDGRLMADLRDEDLLPFRRCIENGLDGIMPAHVIFPQIDAQPAGFSRFWLQQVLRHELQFSGVIFSDDLTMEGASVAGDIIQRSRAALNAGCDMALICNRPDLADKVLDGLVWQRDPVHAARLARLHGRQPIDRATLQSQPHWRQAVHALHQLREQQATPLL